MGVNPYINASIIMQLMTGVVPRLQALSREGEYGRTKINQYTRYLTVPLALCRPTAFSPSCTSSDVVTGCSTSCRVETLSQMVTLAAGALDPDVDRRTDHRARHRQRHQLHHLCRHRQPATGRREPTGPTRTIARRRVRGRRGRRGWRDRLHPGRSAPHPDPVREPRARPADVLGRSDVPAAARQPGRRHPDHLRRQHPAVPAPVGDLLLDLEYPGRQADLRVHRDDLQQHRRRSTSSSTSC